MRIKFITSLFCFLPFIGFSQGEFNNWYFGGAGPPIGAGLTFNSGSPIAIPNGVMGTASSTISVSDSIGNLLFFSNGVNVYNRNKIVMPNGFGLLGADSDLKHFVISTPIPGDDSSYYIFTAAYDNPLVSNPLVYSILNMRLNGGLGDIEPGFKNIPIPGSANSWWSVTGTRHKNNKDVWIITTISTPTQLNYGAFLINNSGIVTTPVLSYSAGCGQYPFVNYWFAPIQIRVSHDGTKLIACFYGHSEFCNFNSQTGSVNRLFFIPTDNFNGNVSAEFSIDSKYLYLSKSTPNGALYQYNATLLDSAAFMQSKVLIDSGYKRNGLQMGPDWKIYGTEYNVDSMSVIQDPSNYGVSCHYQRNAIALTGPNSSTLPQFIQKYKAYIHHTGFCQNDSVHFTGDIYPPPDSVHWDFGDPGSGLNNYSNLFNATHIYANTGTYTVELFVRHIDNRTDTSWQTITILPSPQVALGFDKTICTGSTSTFDAGFCSGCTYEWKNVGSGLIVGTNQTFATGTAGIYCVNVTNGNGCTGKDTVQLTTTPLPVVTNNPPLLKSICTGESTNIPLFGNEPGIMFHWTATLTSGNVTGFTADSGLVINQILINNGATAGVVTYHITPKIGDCAGTPVDYAVTVNVGDPVDVTIAASGNAVCAGTPVTFTATPVNQGTSPVYQWKVNGVNAGSNAPTFAYAPANGDIVTCILTSSNTVCTSNNPATSNAITMVVNPIQPVSVTVSPSANPVCSGTTVNFTALPVNGGSNPSWQWKVNGQVVGSNAPAYSYAPVNGDAVTCTLTSNVQCPSGNPAISGTVTMVVNPNLPVGVTIVASSNPFCAGSSVTFTASPVNGGTTPGYQWKVNGINAGSNSPVLTYSPANGDVVTCSLVSSETCTSGNPAQSNPVTMVVNATLPAGITISASANPFCPGSAVTFTATPVNGGSTPVYQWKVNGTNAGTNSSTFTYNPQNNDSVRCILLSNLNCVTGNPVSSAKIIMSGTLAPVVTFTSCFDTITTVGAKPFRLKGGIPLGGTYSGPGVNGMTGIFTPSVAGTGLKTISYTYTNVASCSAGKSKTILVQPNPAFICGNSFSDIRDGKSYPTVQIGTQCWMAANLNRGTQITSAQVQFDNCVDEKYCFGNDAAKCSKYGGLYQWDEMMRYDDVPEGQGLCPPGWHIPTDNDWTVLCNFYNGYGFAGKPLQDTIIPGFRALPGGIFYLNSSWSFADFAVLFWTSSSWGSYKALSHGMNTINFSVSLYPSSRANAFPVRCLRD
jgi:uncharacterized protein (TIGR02145 family)